MRIKVPIEGTVKSISPNGVVIGDDNDPIRPVRMNPMPRGIGWRMISLDIDNEEMLIEIIPSNDLEICPDKDAALVQTTQRINEIPKISRLKRKDLEVIE